MKIKGIDRTANIAWSPQNQYPIYLAAGTAAQQVDASFSTSAALELYSLNLTDPGYDIGVKASTQSEHRFHKLTWGTHGQPLGVIVGGCDGGIIQIHNPSKLLKGENSLVSQQTKHKGAVQALDFNTFQTNLLASAASDSEIYIWDLNNSTTPMTPGSKCQPLENVESVAWNKQVQHILASTFQTKCVVWDLRKNDPIIKLTDNNTVPIKWQAVAWNPDIATQLCLGSKDDQNSVIQLWDLRFATAPLKIFDNHQRGVLSLSWCHQDTDMLLSCGRDNKIICWNTNNNVAGFDINCEFVLSNQWNFDVSWCPRNPALFACSSFDGQVSIYSLMGGTQQIQTSNKIADSFPGMELYAQAPVCQTHSMPVELRNPPKWLKKPLGAKFGFGGKLVCFGQMKNLQPEPPQSWQVHISQVVTEEQLVTKSRELESALQNEQYIEFCNSKISESNSAHEKLLWQFLAANFEPSPRSEFLNLLGFNKEELTKKLSVMLDRNSNDGDDDLPKVTTQLSQLGRSTDSETEWDHSDDITQPKNFLLGNDSLVPDLKSSTNGSNKYSLSDFNICTGDDVDGLISQALLLGNLEAAVNICIQDNRMADAIILAMTGGSELLAKTQYIYFQKNPGYLSTLISAIVTEDWSHVVKNCKIESWKEALAAVITHSNEQEFAVLCEMLGERLETEKTESLAKNAEFCYICAGNLSKVVTSWLKRGKTTTPDTLQELVELVMILKKAMERQGIYVEISGRLASLFTNYAGILISQGNTEAALSYLGESNDDLISELKDRLLGSLGMNHKYMQFSKRQNHSHPPTQRTSVVPAGFYAPQFDQNDVVTAPPMSHRGFNLNPLNNSTAPVCNNFNPTPYVPVSSVAPVSLPLPGMPPLQPSVPTAVPPTVPMPPTQQSVPPPTRAFASPSPGPGGVTTRSKHVLDPSVQSATSHSNYYTQNQYQSPVYAAKPVPQSTGFGSVAPTLYSLEAFNSGSANLSPPTTAPPLTTVRPPSVAQPGWNDPPVVNSSKSFPKREFVPPSPITQPLLAPSGDATMNGQFCDPHQNRQVQQQHQMNPTALPGHYQHNLPYPQFPPANTHQANLIQSTNHKPVPPEQAEKKPIPEEHAALQKVFDQLRNKCTMAANNPQSKRKLEEVSKKLEILYDGLRDGRLSANTLQVLHLIAQNVQTGEYSKGLMLHTQLVSGPDFSHIAGFMPGIKVLLQSAYQLQVYL